MRIAVVGDIHHLFNQADTSYLNESAHDAVLFVGDLYNYSHQRGLRAAAELAGLTKPALFVPGNHDAIHPAQLAAELSGRRSLQRITAIGHDRRVRQLKRALGGVEVTGYRVHPLDETLDLVVGRPHSCGGPELSFGPSLADAYGVRCIQDSIDRLCALVDECEAPDLMFLAHNGPTGLGERRDDLWGCDFRSGEGDYGDPDLRAAIDYAIQRNKRVVAVIAGHMHHELRGGGQRRWLQRVDHTLYINAARVPRIFKEDGVRYHHHIDLVYERGLCEAVEVLRESDAP